MDKPHITETLINSYEIPFGKDTVTVNEYAPCFTKEEDDINEFKIKSLLAKVFRDNA